MTFDIKAPLFHDLVRLHGKWLPDKAALIDDTKTVTWKTLDERSSQVANGLHVLGIGRGNCVAVLMSNCAEYVEIMYGVLKAGAVIVPLNVAVQDDGLVGMLRDSDARAVFYSPDQFARLTGRHGDLPDGTRHFVFGADDPLPGTDDYEAWRDACSDAEPGIEIGDDDPCNIIYSSGTTGLPKGITHLYRRRIQSMYELSLAHRYHFDAVSICAIGLYSSIAWGSLFCSLLVGGTCVIRDKFDPGLWVGTVEEYGVTHTFMAPIMFQRVLDHEDFRPESVASLQAVISGGAPLYESLKKRIAENFGCVVIELYGLTEGFMTTLQPGDADGRLTSVGKPVRGNDLILVDVDDNEVGFGGTGEICVRSVHWMTGYHNRPEATMEAEYIDSRGVKWLRTGDIGRTDAEGFLYITDRKKDMIISGGQNIYPIDIEAVLIDHPMVSEIAVIGVPDETWGETPIAIVVPRSGATADTAEEILTWANARLGKRQRIKRVVLQADMPRNPNGKVLKRELRMTYI
ncbi:class I adenylate-forming enzyme family protein [Hyphomonas sp.]|uniref:class I adenylate-forming enzyme family protein n=1 Tax=Hyphomonas sp. TaxID=87 RepID=UPI00356A3B24